MMTQLFQKFKLLNIKFYFFILSLLCGTVLFFSFFTEKPLYKLFKLNLLKENFKEENFMEEKLKEERLQKSLKKDSLQEENSQEESLKADDLKDKNQTGKTTQLNSINSKKTDPGAVSRESDQNPQGTNNSSTIKTACREIPLKENFKAPSHRVEKLNRLMDEAIDWVVTDINGKQIDLYCLRDKKVVVLNFWATWCSPCIRELPSLSQLAESYKEDIFILAVSTENQNTVKNFLERSFKGLSPELKIAVVNEEEKLQRFPKDKIPTTYIFNKEGRLKIKQLGEKNWSDENIVQQILN